MTRSSWDIIALKSVLVLGIAIVAVGLAWLNTWGAWQASKSYPYTAAILGAEICISVTLALIFLSPTRLRIWIGSGLFCVLVWICVENGSVGVKTALADVFTGDPETIRLENEVKRAELVKLSSRAEDYRARASAQQEQVDSQVARNVVTASQPYQERVDELLALAVSTDNEALQVRRDIIQNEAKADLIENRTVWLYGLLIGLEGFRAFGLWCFVLWKPKPIVKEQKTTITINGEEYDPDFVSKAVKDKENHLQSVRDSNEKKKAKKAISGHITDTPWALERRAEIWELHQQNMTLFEIAQTLKRDPSELGNLLPKLFTASEIEAIRSVGAPQDDSKAVA